MNVVWIREISPGCILSESCKIGRTRAAEPLTVKLPAPTSTCRSRILSSRTLNRRFWPTRYECQVLGAKRTFGGSNFCARESPQLAGLSQWGVQVGRRKPATQADWGRSRLMKSKCNYDRRVVAGTTCSWGSPTAAVGQPCDQVKDCLRGWPRTHSRGQDRPLRSAAPTFPMNSVRQFKQASDSRTGPVSVVNRRFGSAFRFQVI